MCKKSIFNIQQIEPQIDAQLAAMPMPEEYKDTKMLMLCNDCSKLSEVPFHILGGKCRSCRSYNTTRTDGDNDLKARYAREIEKEE